MAMFTQVQSDTLRDKISQTGTAVIHCTEDNFFNQEAVMATIIQVDKNGNLWMAVDKPVKCMDGSSGSFDIVVNCHNQGLSFDMDILGDAKLITAEQEINALPADAIAMYNDGKLILRVDILDIDYWERKMPIYKSIAHKIKYMFSIPATENNKERLYGERQMSA